MLYSFDNFDLPRGGGGATCRTRKKFSCTRPARLVVHKRSVGRASLHLLLP